MIRFSLAASAMVLTMSSAFAGDGWYRGPCNCAPFLTEPVVVREHVLSPSDIAPPFYIVDQGPHYSGPLIIGLAPVVENDVALPHYPYVGHRHRHDRHDRISVLKYQNYRPLAPRIVPVERRR